MFKTPRCIALSLIGALALGIPIATAMEVGVSPPRFEIEFNNKTRTQSLNVTNLSSKPVEMKAYVRTWTTTEDNKFQEAQSTEQSLDRWIVFTPSRFTIPPRSSQTIRFEIRPKVKPSPGEHRAVLYLEEVPPGGEDSQAVVAIGRLGVVIYGYSGEIKRVGALNSVRVDTKPNGATAVFDISSTGNAHVRVKGQYAIWSAAKYPGAAATKALPDVENPQAKLPENVLNAGLLDFSAVLPGTRRQLLLPISKKLPPGKYVLDINGDLSGTRIDQGIPFTIPASSATQK
ncbi:MULTISPECIES: fimbrial biogenesis chaperone [Nostocales]|uniref:Fimbria/pilus periplasmic chaperone n=3 Tax=Nostocales TaxID=1161 RepID=A0A0C1R581_9CYAN|nr:fimbria/pilus periplasmic chaperone [Tolypothrix bouteillei]KAF3889046.1 fimbria/pilus periplasmic chaperone [Tolypothrix bouteillei VB521301]